MSGGRHAALDAEPDLGPSPEPRSARSGRRFLLLAVAGAALVLLVAGLVVATTGDEPAEPEGSFVVAAWLPTWDRQGSESLPAALEQGGVREVSPTWATVGPDGELALTPPPDQDLDRLAAAGATVIPVVQNVQDGHWRGPMMAALLADPAREERHRGALVDAAVEHGWDGVDIDYESLPSSAGQALLGFLEALREDLHEHDLVLAVTVPARTSDQPPYDYAEIGAIADQVRVMAYDHAWSGSPAGPIAPPDWIREVVAYATDRIPADKVMLGIGTYGYDWVGSRGVDVGAADAAALAAETGAEPRWDDDAAAMTFTYERDGRAHTVWYEDARSLEAKQQIAVDAGLRGIALWRLGGEDPEAWATVGRLTGDGDS